ncbi:MAG TPA: serine/threonine-protein kinase [Polyangiales bacterium]|nr:serine/threonine-protein kinase [Polyangiales bacterium]
MWRAGQRVGEYELVAQLREGGMATLFLGRRSGAAGFSRPVAIKVVHPELADDEQFRNMFLDEARLSARIQHPNVVHVEELGQHEGTHFLVMEFVHGCSLSQLQRTLLQRRRRLAPAYAVQIAMQVADALHAAHELVDERNRLLDVVHRDVTPENILLAYGGHVKLIDFGIAKAYGRRHRTMDGLLKGKFRYMAPEQALGKPVDRRVDIYQLGIVLWEMLCLRRLFDAERDVDLLAQVQKPLVKPPSTFVDRVPPALDDAVMAALDPDPRRRPADAQAFARLLGRAVPSAREVDSGSLRGLLLATMNEHRQREKTTYPPGVYERLDKAVETEPLGGAQRHATALALQPTYEHTEPLGSDSRQGEVTRGSDRPRRERKPRRLVRLASELRTTLTRIVESGFVGSRVYWIGIGSALGLGAALVLIGLVVRPRERAVPALPLAMLPAALPVVEAPKPEAPKLDALTQTALEVPPSHALVPDAGRPKRQRHHHVKKERGMVFVDETPLLTEPGF